MPLLGLRLLLRVGAPRLQLGKGPAPPSLWVRLYSRLPCGQGVLLPKRLAFPPPGPLPRAAASLPPPQSPAWPPGGSGAAPSAPGVVAAGAGRAGGHPALPSLYSLPSAPPPPLLPHSAAFALLRVAWHLPRRVWSRPTAEPTARRARATQVPEPPRRRHLCLCQGGTPASRWDPALPGAPYFPLFPLPATRGAERRGWSPRATWGPGGRGRLGGVTGGARVWREGRRGLSAPRSQALGRPPGRGASGRAVQGRQPSLGAHLPGAPERTSHLANFFSRSSCYFGN